MVSYMFSDLISIHEIGIKISFLSEIIFFILIAH